MEGKYFKAKLNHGEDEMNVKIALRMNQLGMYKTKAYIS
jgi:hypothetical protein